jgi:predicted acyltransferase
VGTEHWFWPAQCTAQTRLDYASFGSQHMYAPDYDPEGLLSTVTTAVITVCAGSFRLQGMEEADIRDDNIRVSYSFTSKVLYF